MKPLVKVVWYDTQDMGESWSDETSITEFGDIPCEIVSVGYLISKGPKYHTLGADWHEAEGDYGRVTKVASGMIQSIEYLIVDPKSPESA